MCNARGYESLKLLLVDINQNTSSVVSVKHVLKTESVWATAKMMHMRKATNQSFRRCLARAWPLHPAPAPTRDAHRVVYIQLDHFPQGWRFMYSNSVWQLVFLDILPKAHMIQISTYELSIITLSLGEICKWSPETMLYTYICKWRVTDIVPVFTCSSTKPWRHNRTGHAVPRLSLDARRPRQEALTRNQSVIVSITAPRESISSATKFHRVCPSAGATGACTEGGGGSRGVPAVRRRRMNRLYV